MRLPSRLDFGVALIPLRQLSTKEMREVAECEEEDVTPDGLWDADSDTIYLLKHIPNRRKRVALFHEVIHCANDNNYWQRWEMGK